MDPIFARIADLTRALELLVRHEDALRRQEEGDDLVG